MSDPNQLILMGLLLLLFIAGPVMNHARRWLVKRMTKYLAEVEASSDSTSVQTASGHELSPKYAVVREERPHRFAVQSSQPAAPIDERRPPSPKSRRLPRRSPGPRPGTHERTSATELRRAFRLMLLLSPPRALEDFAAQPASSGSPRLSTLDRSEPPSGPTLRQ